MRKTGRDAYNEIREKLKAKSIFKVTSSRVRENKSVDIGMPPALLPISSFSEDQGCYRNISAFDEKYQLIGKIGEGGNAVIKKCQQRATQKIFAVKISNMSDEHLIQLKKVFKMVKALTNPHILKYKQLYLNSKQHTCYLVTQYLPFPTLRKFPSLPEPQLRSIVKQLLEVVLCLHSNRICHRDIKPDNILYDETQKSIHLIDFGISKRVFKRNTRKEMWTPTGTLAYKAPEMLEGVSYTEAVDMWALGVTLFQMVTGREPFYEEYLIDTIQKIRNIEYEFGEEWGNYSKFAKDLVSRLLKQRSSRLTAEQALKHPWFLQSPPSPAPSKACTTQQLSNNSQVTARQPEQIPLLSRNSTMDFNTADIWCVRMQSVDAKDLPELLQSIAQLKESVNEYDIING